MLRIGPLAILSLLWCGVQGAFITFQPAGVPFKSPVTVAPGFAARVLFSNLTLPRGIMFDHAANLLVVERGLGVTAFSEVTDGSGWERTLVIQNANFTQGIQLDGNHLYVSTPGEVLRFDYDSKTKSISGSPHVIVNGIPADGDLTTHALQLEDIDYGTNILIACGPFTNIDPTARDPASGRSQIRRFFLGDDNTPQSFLTGELLALGLRNPNGFSLSPFSPSTTLFAVDNGASVDNVTGLTAAFVNDNPADELDLVLGGPAFFGFPDCTTLWNPLADPIGDPQYVNLPVGAQISLHLEPERDDAWCANVANNRPPVLSFQAHSAPLDIKFYTPSEAAEGPAFPSAFSGDAFVSFHGSFSRRPPTGYGIVRVPFIGGAPTSQDYAFLVQATMLSTCPKGCIRPVGLAFGKDGRLYASSDSSGELFVLESVG